MDVTIIGTGNMARGLGRRLIAGGHTVTVLGKRTEDAEAVVGDIGANGSAKAGRTGDAIADDVVMLTGARLVKAFNRRPWRRWRATAA